MASKVTLVHGDCLAVMRELEPESVDAIVTDPPYGLEFMGKEWDKFKPAASRIREPSERDQQEGSAHNSSTFLASRRMPDAYVAGTPFQEWFTEVATEALRVLKPGGHMLAFGGTRTWHRLACAVEDAGFEVRDSIAWLYGSGFPKSLDVSKAIDKAAGAQREVVGSKLGQPGYSLAPSTGGNLYEGSFGGTGDPVKESQVTAPATADAQRWEGWGTALKPAFEPIVVARKPLTGTVAANVLAHGTGALNIDATRVATDEDTRRPFGTPSAHVGQLRNLRPGELNTGSDKGRWPANVVLDESQAHALDQMSGPLHTQDPATRNGRKSRGWTPSGVDGREVQRTPNGNGGLSEKGTGASRFFYVAKAPKKERPKVDDIAHPTVKPLALMRWLVKLVTPPGGVVLDPFAGSGATLEAAMLEDVDCIVVEREADYLPLIRHRYLRQTYEGVSYE